MKVLLSMLVWPAPGRPDPRARIAALRMAFRAVRPADSISPEDLVLPSHRAMGPHRRSDRLVGQKRVGMSGNDQHEVARVSTVRRNPAHSESPAGIAKGFL